MSLWASKKNVESRFEIKQWLCRNIFCTFLVIVVYKHYMLFFYNFIYFSNKNNIQLLQSQFNVFHTLNVT